MKLADLSTERNTFIVDNETARELAMECGCVSHLTREMYKLGSTFCETETSTHFLHFGYFYGNKGTHENGFTLMAYSKKFMTKEESDKLLRSYPNLLDASGSVIRDFPAVPNN